MKEGKKGQGRGKGEGTSEEAIRVELTEEFKEKGFDGIGTDSNKDCAKPCEPRFRLRG